MKIIDLSRAISPGMPVYPGTDPPVFITGSSIDEAGFLEKKITMYSHTGTHIDAPAHIINGAKCLDQLSIEHFYGRAFLLNLTPTINQSIEVENLKPHQNLVRNSDFILLNTGWSKFWGSERYFYDYPVLSPEAAEWLSGFQLKGVGLDMISADEPDSQDFPVHKIFLSHDIIIIENLTNLDAISGNRFIFSCFPLKIGKADGSPVRAVAITQ